MKIKQYIVLRHAISPPLACIAVGHGVLAAYLKWQNDPIVKEWVSGIFYKVICQARDQREWDAIKQWKEDKITMTESSVDNLEVAVVFKPFLFTKGSIFNELSLYPGTPCLSK